jgi:hypothetical protein
VDNDPCSTNVFWSTINAASADSTLAGLLAGLLIAAAAALIVQWYQGSDPHTIALFGSGVPSLTLSTYLFTVIAGVHFKEDTDPQGPICSQLWSQWLLAISLLFLGSAVLVCGLGWALISYADNLAVKLCERGIPIDAVEDRRKFFIRLNGWLSGTIITAATAFPIVSNVIYLKAIGYQNLNPSFKWYLHPLWRGVLDELILGDQVQPQRYAVSRVTGGLGRVEEDDRLLGADQGLHRRIGRERIPENAPNPAAHGREHLRTAHAPEDRNGASPERRIAVAGQFFGPGIVRAWTAVESSSVRPPPSLGNPTFLNRGGAGSADGAGDASLRCRHRLVASVGRPGQRGGHATVWFCG